MWCCSMFDAAVVGAGIFGSIIAHALRQDGHRVVMFDDARPEAGSRPAACLMKPSWFSSLGKEVYNPALAKLDDLYTIRELKFKVSLVSHNISWIPPSAILKNRDVVRRRVNRMEHNGKRWWLDAGEAYSARVVIVAAGIWTQLLIPEVKQRGLAGMAFLWPQERIEVPFVRVWAPYRQLVAFNRGDGLWVGDGSAILKANWTELHAERSYNRCIDALGRELLGVPKQLFGIRPYHERKPCYLAEVRPRLWVATGGAKNGTLAAGWCAHELSQRLA